MSEPFYIARDHVRAHKTHVTLKAWGMSQADLARGRGAKFSRISTNPITGEVVFEAWMDEHPDPGAPRWGGSDS